MAEGPTEWKWDDWTRALADYHFPLDSRSVPVRYGVDEGSLSRITSLPGHEAVEQLMRVVRLHAGGHRYGALNALCERWARGARCDPPPSLPLLAVGVLAVSKMGKNGLNPSNYYQPYRALFDPDDTTDGAPDDYINYVPRMWHQVSRWLDEDLNGGRGSSTIAPHPAFPNIGYALGQALVRASDQLAIHRFFDWLQLDPDDRADDPAPAEMRAYLELWTRGKETLTKARLHRLASLVGLSEQCDDLIKASLALWTPVDDAKPVARKSGSLRVLLDTLPIGLHIAAERPVGFPDQATFSGTNASDQFELRASIDSWYAPIPLPGVDPRSVLTSGMEITGPGGRVLAHSPTKVIALRWSDDLGCFASVDRITFGETHHLLVEGGTRLSVEKFIADEGLEAPIDPSATQLLCGGTWFLFTGFRLDASVQTEPPPDLAQLIGGGGGPRLRLTRGLAIGPAKRVYIRGGAPHLACPPHPTELKFELRWSGFPEPHHFVAPQNDGEFPLEALQLRAGDYTITHAGKQLTFRVSDGLVEKTAPGTGSLSTPGDGGSARGYIVARGDGTTCRPAELPTAIASPPPGVFRVWLGPSPTDYFRAVDPRWLSELAGGLTWSVVERDCPFDPVWQIETDGQHFTATMCRSEPPQPARGSGRTLWARVIPKSALAPGATPEAQDLWLEYQRAVEQSR